MRVEEIQRCRGTSETEQRIDVEKIPRESQGEKALRTCFGGYQIPPPFSLPFLRPQCRNIAVELKVVSTDGKYSYFFFLSGSAYHTV